MKLTVLFAVIVFFHSVALKAQLCAGSLGDPIINVTFGAGHVGPETGRTTFKYVSDCPEKGQYALSNFLNGCGKDSSLAQIGDHTLNQNGNCMLVNGANSPGTVHLDTATGLCGNTTYQFAAWIINALLNFSCDGMADYPDLIFTVKSLTGQLIATYNTGLISISRSRTWDHYGFCFQTPADINTVVLMIESTAGNGSGCGSSFAIDDITLNSCGPSISITLDGSDQPVQVCADYTNPFVLQAEYSAGFADPVLQWQSSADSGKTWTNITGATATTYSIPRRRTGEIIYRILVSERDNFGSPGCSNASNTIFTVVHELPVHTDPRTITGCTGTDLLLPGVNAESVEVLWTGPRGYSSAIKTPVIPDVQYADSGLYTLKETFLSGCTSLDSFYLELHPGTSVEVTPPYPICEGMSETLLATATGNVSFQWTPVTGLSNDAVPNPIARPVDSTIYKIIITNEYGCKDSAYLPVYVYRRPESNAGPDKTIMAGDTAMLNGIVKGTAVNYSWSPANFINDNQLKQPSVFPASATTYTLNVFSTVGCGSSSDNVLVNVYNDLFIPSAFTPNNDGKNDRFRIGLFDNYTIKSLSIFNRWGGLVYRAKNPYEGWDGTSHGEPQPAGVYVYYFDIQSASKKTITKRGTITLIR
ncbi:MAG: gliding motility-associated C-terminal domain-containing protein [Bacteroidota bacterium]